MPLFTANEKGFMNMALVLSSWQDRVEFLLHVNAMDHDYIFTWSVTAQYVFNEFYDPKGHETCSHINCHN